MSIDTRSSLFRASSRFTFVFGLVTGIAVLSTVGLTISLGMLLNDGEGSARVAEVPQPAAAAAVPTDATGQPPTPQGNAAAIRAVGETDHVRGNPDAAITLLEYSDFECPFCNQHHPNLQQLLTEYPDDIRWVYRHFPLSFHPEAQGSAEASECAAEQGKFWEFADQLFANQSSLGAELYTQLAGELALDGDAFQACLDSGEKATLVQEDYAEGVAAGVSGTPATFLNDTLISGAVPYAQLKAQVEGLL